MSSYQHINEEGIMKSKEEFIRMLHAKIDEWNGKIDKLEAKRSRIEAESREEFYARIAELKSKKMQVEEKLEEVKKSGDSAFQDLKSGMELASMAEALNSAMSRFK